MNEVITKLYKIEEKADRILDEANNKKAEMQRQLEEEHKNWEQETKNEMQNNLLELRREMEVQAGAQLKIIEDRYQGQIGKLEEQYGCQLDEMAAKIFKRITEV